MRTRRSPNGLAVYVALPVGFAALFAVGTVTAALHGRLTATGVLIVSALAVGVLSFLSEPLASAPLAVIGWLTAVGFSRPPYSVLRPTGPFAEQAAFVLALAAGVGAGAGQAGQWWARRHILETMGRTAGAGHGTLSARRRLAGVVLAVAALSLLTTVLSAARAGLTLTDHLLFYLVIVVAVTVVGGFWPAVLAAVASSMLLNWFFTPPVHTFTIGEPQNLLALLLFVAVAVAVSSVVHLAALRTSQAEHSRAEAGSLLALAQTVLGGDDTPTAILDHLTATQGGHAELKEKVAGRWVPVAASGPPAAGPVTVVRAGEDLALEAGGQSAGTTPTLLAGFAAQAAAALERERLRTQAAQSEALAAGNRMRTALLAAVSHDLRTPLASIKASVSSLRQNDLHLSAADQEDLLATIEENSDRLDGLIGNLLDMSRIHTGSLQPFLRPVTIDEVAPVALRGLDAPASVELAVPDGLPLLLADPGLLERVLANLFSNAIHYSPPTRPPVLRACRTGGAVALEVADHGPGVPDELKSRIFEPFQRFNDRKAGVGLGLAVAKGFTEAMGGSIVAADTSGGGLTIRVTLPVASLDTEPVRGVQA